MSSFAAKVLIWAISLWIIFVGFAAVTLTLLGVTWSLALGGVFSGFLGILWVLAWVIYYRWV